MKSLSTVTGDSVKETMAFKLSSTKCMVDFLGYSNNIIN